MNWLSQERLGFVLGFAGQGRSVLLAGITVTALNS